MNITPWKFLLPLLFILVALAASSASAQEKSVEVLPRMRKATRLPKNLKGLDPPMK